MSPHTDAGALLKLAEELSRYKVKDLDFVLATLLESAQEAIERYAASFQAASQGRAGGERSEVQTAEVARVAEAIRLRSCERGYPVHPNVAHHLAAAALDAMPASAQEALDRDTIATLTQQVLAYQEQLAQPVPMPPEPYWLPFKVVGGCIRDAKDNYVAELSSPFGGQTRDEMAQFLVDAANVAKAAPDYSAWLIEMPERFGPLYFHFEHDDDWTKDHDKACHFSRKEDAEKVIEHYGWTRAVAVEHMWPTASSVPSAEGNTP